MYESDLDEISLWFSNILTSAVTRINCSVLIINTNKQRRGQLTNTVYADTELTENSLQILDDFFTNFPLTAADTKFWKKIRYDIS